MTIPFFKFQGAGNDFILFDNRSKKIPTLSTEQYKLLCDRKFGIGADGLMILEEAQGYDFQMLYFNADGRESSMCGNGGRCIVRFAERLGLVKNEANFLAVDGQHYAKISDSQVELHMNELHSFERDGAAYVLNTGSPHFVQWVEGLEQFDVFSKGRAIRYNAIYGQEGINVNFVQDFQDGIMVRTYERGVENETLSCGTGVTAAAISNSLRQGKLGRQSQIIYTPGGQLRVEFDREDLHFTNVVLIGPAEFVFQGEVQVDELKF